MGAVRVHRKMGAKRPSKIPSFVYRQDGHELTYEIEGIIAKNREMSRISDFCPVGEGFPLSPKRKFYSAKLSGKRAARVLSSYPSGVTM